MQGMLSGGERRVRAKRNEGKVSGRARQGRKDGAEYWGFCTNVIGRQTKKSVCTRSQCRARELAEEDKKRCDLETQKHSNFVVFVLAAAFIFDGGLL